jgi:hypothetical protein
LGGAAAAAAAKLLRVVDRLLPDGAEKLFGAWCNSDA